MCTVLGLTHFAVFWLVATRSIKSGLPPTVFDSIAAGDAAAVAEWALRTPLEEQVGQQCSFATACKVMCVFQMAVSKREQWAALHAAAHSGHDGIVQVMCCLAPSRGRCSCNLTRNTDAAASRSRCQRMRHAQSDSATPCRSQWEPPNGSPYCPPCTLVCTH